MRLKTRSRVPRALQLTGDDMLRRWAALRLTCDVLPARPTARVWEDAAPSNLTVVGWRDSLYDDVAWLCVMNAGEVWAAQAAAALGERAPLVSTMLKVHLRRPLVLREVEVTEVNEELRAREEAAAPRDGFLAGFRREWRRLQLAHETNLLRPEPAELDEVTRVLRQVAPRDQVVSELRDGRVGF